MGPPMNADSTKSQFHPLPFYKTNPFRSGLGKPLYNTNPFRQFVDSRFTIRTRVPFCGCGYEAAVNADSGKSRFLPLPFYKTNRPRAARKAALQYEPIPMGSWILALQNEPAVEFAAVVMGPMNID